MNTFDCSGTIVFTVNGTNEYITCDSGSWTVVPVKDVESVFTEFLAPDEAIITMIMGMSLVFWVIGHCLGRIVSVMRKL